MHEKESCEAGFSACSGSRKRHSSVPLQCDPRGAFLSYGNEVSYTIKNAPSGAFFFLVQVEIKSNVQQDADSCGNRCGKSDPCQAGVWLDTHEVSEGETDAEGLDQTLEHNPEGFVVTVEVADHAEQNSGDDGFGRKAL